MKIKFNDFRRGINRKNSDNLIALSEAKNCCNFDFSGGSLKTSFPFEPCFEGFLTSEVISEEFTEEGERLAGGAIFYFKKFDFGEGKDASKLVLVTPKLNTFYLPLGESDAIFKPLGIRFSSLPSAINYRLDSEDVIIFSSPTDNMVVWNGESEPEIIIDAPKITSMCLHNERLFATTDDGLNTVWFSDDLDPTNWSVSLVDAGFIQLVDERGAPKKVISFNGYVYIFREKGISRLSASGGQEEFYLSHLFVSSGKIYDKTICLCGDKIIFLASDGLYSFNGTDTTKILIDIKDLFLQVPKTTACFFDGKYYLTVHADFDGGQAEANKEKANALFVLDTTTSEYLLHGGIGVSSMAISEQGEAHTLYFLNDFIEDSESLISFFNKDKKDSPYSKYITGLYDFGDPQKKKTVRKITTYKTGEGELSVKIFNETGCSVEVEPKSDFSSMPVLLSGKALGFEICASGEIELENLVLEVY